MNQVLPKLKIFAAPYPETATAVINLLASEKLVMRRRISEAMPAGTSTHYIRKTLIHLQTLGFITVSQHGEYRLAMAASAIQSLTPVRMSKVERLILRLINDRGDITASDMLSAYGILRSQFLRAVAQLIARGIVRSYDIPMHDKTRRYRRFYAFNNTATE